HYDVKPENIEVAIHPESVIHSAVEFADTAVMAQLGTPDMRLPIQYAFSYPERLPLASEPLDLFRLGTLHFERPDMQRFPCLALAYEAIGRGGNVPCMLNAAGEVTNLAFRQGRISFPRMAQVIRQVMEQASFLPTPSLDDLFSTDAACRRMAEALL
ncbi:MAG: 1-deoxy-D-xylulose-5-phosphate reductoisomerase, partial [Alloprevotella sp.]